MYKVMSEEKKDELDRVTLKSDTLRKYFPKNYTPRKWNRSLSSYWISGRKNGASERAVKDIQKKVGHPARRKE